MISNCDVVDRTVWEDLLQQTSIIVIAGQCQHGYTQHVKIRLQRLVGRQAAIFAKVTGRQYQVRRIGLYFFQQVFEVYMRVFTTVFLRRITGKMAIGNLNDTQDGLQCDINPDPASWNLPARYPVLPPYQH